MSLAIPILLSLAFLGQSAPDTAGFGKANADLKVMISKASQQPPASYAAGEKVIAYNTGSKVTGYSSFQALSEFFIELDNWTHAKILGDEKALAEETSKCKALVRSQNEQRLTIAVPSGTLLEVVSIRWVTLPKRQGLLALRVPGLYACELRCIDLESPAKGQSCWIAEDELVPTTQRLLPPATPTRTERSAQLMLYFEAHQRADPRNQSVGNEPLSSTKPDSDAEPEPLGKPAKRAQPSPRFEPDSAPALSVALVDYNDGVADNRYKIYVEIRNTSSTTLEYLKMTALYKSENDRLLHTEWAFADPHTVKPGETTTIELSTKQNVDSIHHYNLKFESGNRNVRFTKPTR
ncbi:MAG: hypothetical protein ACLP7Q_13590 [Isosphaeraceae bacterium]